MSFVAVATGVISAGVGVFKAVQGKKAADAAAEQAEASRIEMDKHKEAYQKLDTSNPYLNMENTMEDLTVNQQEAEFAQQGALQSQANVMGQMRGAAGASGIAALAQSMANQGSLDAQKAAVSIGEQEAANQQSERAESSRIQGLELQGEMQKRQMEQQKIDVLMGMSAGDVSSAQALQQEGMEAMTSGISDAAAGAGQAAGGIHEAITG
jgi:hypothetical protein